jgi:hypothetical protein
MNEADRDAWAVFLPIVTSIIFIVGIAVLVFLAQRCRTADRNSCLAQCLGADAGADKCMEFCAPW